MQNNIIPNSLKEGLTPKMKAELKKAKKRAKINAATGEGVEIIPAIREQKDIFDDATKKLVGIYVRVSTDDSNQTTSYEMQKNYYEDFVKKHPNWTLVEIFADEGISGTSLKKRDNFMRMIQACEEGRVNLIIVKQVSRFARNIVDCLGYVRKLAALRPTPVGVFFEIDNIYTLNPEMEMQLNFASMLAQEESHMKSKLLTDAYRKKSRYGIVYAPELLGYDLDDDDNLIINEDEAQTIKLRDDLFKEKVGAVSVKEIVRTAKERRLGSIGYADVMLSIYNKQMKNPLQWIKLRQAPRQTYNSIAVFDLNDAEVEKIDE